MPQHLENQVCCPPWPSASLVAIGRSGEFAAFGYVASIGLPITNLSDIVPCLRDDVRLPFTNHQSLLTSHGRASGPTAAFSAARDFEKILGSGFEMIRISQCESASVFGL